MKKEKCVMVFSNLDELLKTDVSKIDLNETTIVIEGVEKIVPNEMNKEMEKAITKIMNKENKSGLSYFEYLLKKASMQPDYGDFDLIKQRVEDLEFCVNEAREILKDSGFHLLRGGRESLQTHLDEGEKCAKRLAFALDFKDGVEKSLSVQKPFKLPKRATLSHPKRKR